jgi:soluble P-type ATPase
MEIDVPGLGPLSLETLILDLNGTIAIDGCLILGVKERIASLRAQGWRITMFTGDTHGNGKKIAEELGVEIFLTPDADAKMLAALAIDPTTCATIGNGRIDFELFKTVKLRVCTIQAEGAFGPLLAASDIVVSSVLDGLDILLNPKRIAATLRT